MKTAQKLDALFLEDLQRMREMCRSIEVLILCTEDGFNVCSSGVTDAQVSKLSAVISSLMALGEGAFSSLDVRSPISNVVIECSISKIVIERVPIRKPRFFLMAKTSAAQLGAVLVAVRQGSVAIARKFSGKPNTDNHTHSGEAST